MRFYTVMPMRHTKVVRRFLLAFAPLLFAAFATAAGPAPHKGKYLMYVGTYTEEGSKSKGIYAYRYDSDSSQITPLGLAAETINPSFIALSPDHRYLYAVNEVQSYKGPDSGGVSAFAIDPVSSKLTLLNTVSSRGADPCYITVDKTGKNVLVANYTGGNVAVFPVLADGRLGEASDVVQHIGHGPNAKRQESPHAHSVDLTSDSRFAITDDLGLDQIFVNPFDSVKGTLSANDSRIVKVEPGAGPRHFAFHPNGKFAYVINELQSTVTAFGFDGALGALHALQTISTLPKTFTSENTDAEIEVDSAGQFLYASNRGADSIAVFSIDSMKGTLTLVEIVSTQGKEPRSFEIDPAGKLLFAANQKSDNIVIFHVDAATGRLTPTGQVIAAPSPVCLKFMAVE